MIVSVNLVSIRLRIALLLFVALVFLPVGPNDVFAQQSIKISSPDGTMVASITTSDGLRLSYSVDGLPVIAPSRIGMTIDGIKLGQSVTLDSVEERSHNQLVKPVMNARTTALVDQYNEKTLMFSGGKFSMTVRAYDEGIAYRFNTSLPGEIVVNYEEATYNFVDNQTVHFPREEGFVSHNERLYETVNLASISSGDLASLPLLVDTNTAKLLITETDLRDYPGMWMRGGDGHVLSADFPKAVTASHMKNDRDSVIDERAEYIARVKGTRSFPWRIIGTARADHDLLNINMPYLLAEPSRLTDTSWIKGGQIAWDWYNANNLFGVDFKAGLNTETYKYYIDFAAENGIEYIILDEGWYTLGDVLDINPDMDVQGIIDYGKSRNVDVILWVVWETLDQKLDEALDAFARWGAAGIKVDFMQRDDQWMVNYYWRIAEAAAKRKLIVDYHGAHKPAGLWRTYPNTLTYEGVLGLEHSKWSDNSSPQHNVTLPFIRMAVGPTDFTPGAMVNAHPKNRIIAFERPMSIGTRMHQVAMYVVFESPLQMLADSPSLYRREQETVDFITAVPTTWDETVPLSGMVGDYVAVARRKGDVWYVGAMTDENARDIDVDLSFLGDGTYDAVIMQDGSNVDRWASDYQQLKVDVTSVTVLTAKMFGGGGWAARISPRR